MLIYNSDSVKVKYDEVQDVLFLNCLKSFSPEEFKSGMERALQHAYKHTIKRWILNVNNIGVLNEEAEKWLQLNLFPKIMSRLGADNFMAVVLSEHRYKALLSEAGLIGLKSYNSFIRLNTFCKEDDALLWLGTEPVSCLSA